MSDDALVPVACAKRQCREVSDSWLIAEGLGWERVNGDDYCLLHAPEARRAGRLAAEAARHQEYVARNKTR